MSVVMQASGTPEAGELLPLLSGHDEWRVPEYEELARDCPELEIVTRRFSPQLDLLICFPDEGTFRYLARRHLAKLQMDADEALATAAVNIDARHARFFFTTKGGALSSVSLLVPGTRLLDRRGSGIMLAAAFWRGIAATSPRPLLASVCNRDFVSVVFLNAEQNLPGLRHVFRSFYENEEHPLSHELFRWNGSGWELA